MTTTSATVTPTLSRSTRVARYDTVVIGGGQAGLAVAQQLLARNHDDLVILDASDRIGDAWRQRWDSLRLFTPAAYDALPGLPFPAPPGHFPDKDEVAEYLERYALRFDLPVKSGVRVTRLGHDGDRFVMHTNAGTFEADHVIVATGPFHRPLVPELSTRLDPAIRQLHASEYRHPFSLPEGPALVVGAGNSGAQIALELARVRKVWLAGRDTGYLPRRLLGRDLFDWLWPIMAHAPALGRRMRRRNAQRGDPRIGIPSSALRQAGITRVGRITGVRGALPVAGDLVMQPTVIVWSTGFAPDYSWIDLPVFKANGLPRHERGVATGVAGLSFLGLRYQHRLNSALLGGVGADAAWVAAHVAQRAAANG